MIFKTLRQALIIHQRKIHPTLLGVAGALWAIRFTSSTIIPQHIATSVTASVILYVLWDVAQNTYLPHKSKVFSSQEDLYAELALHIGTSRVRNAVFIQYSGKEARSLCSKLLRNGAKVTLYVKDVDTAISEEQTERIVTTKRGYRTEISNSDDFERLTIVPYAIPPSFRAVLIDRRVLAIGWYRHEYALQPHPDFADDDIALSGHDMPGILCFKGSDEFEAFSTMVQEMIDNYHNGKESDVFNRIKKKKKTMKEFIKSEHLLLK